MQEVRACTRAYKPQHYSLKRKPLLLATSFLILLILIGTVQGVATGNVEISSNGTIVYPTPTPTPTPTPSPTPSPSPSGNLAPIPEGWNLRDLGHVDSSVLHNGHVSIRIDGPPTSVNPWRECNTVGIIPVKPGDHIVFKIWIKTGHSTIGNDGKPYMGGLMGIDLFGPSGRLWEISPGTTTDYTYDPTWSWQAGYEWVPYNSDWTLRVLDYVIPANYFTTTDSGQPIPSQQVTGFIAWFYMHNEPDAGSGWFADAELYINP